jgi:chromosome segregation ATPase
VVQVADSGLSHTTSALHLSDVADHADAAETTPRTTTIDARKEITSDTLRRKAAEWSTERAAHDAKVSVMRKQVDSLQEQLMHAQMETAAVRQELAFAQVSEICDCIEKNG